MPALARIACVLGLLAACSGKPSPPTGGGSTSPAAQGSSAGAAPAPAPAAEPSAAPGDPCGPRDCGPQMGMPSRRCPDGSIGGPTGRCLRQASGRCGWEIRPCP